MHPRERILFESSENAPRALAAMADQAGRKQSTLSSHPPPLL